MRDPLSLAECRCLNGAGFVPFRENDAFLDLPGFLSE